MRSMVIDRRTFLAAAAGLCIARPGFAAAQPIYLSARADRAGGYGVAAFDAAGRRLFDLPQPGRGHAFAIHPSRALAVHFARRPGRFARVLDLAAGAVSRTIESRPDRHFYGHGVFAPDGELLYATENDFAGERGVIGVYDAADGWRRVGEFDAHGIGPHDIHLLSDGVTLAVAIGGILTRPDLPRIKLNLPTMRPSLAYIDRRDGRLLGAARLAPSQHLLGIRHLARRADDLIAFAMQYEGPAGDLVPLVGLHRRGAAPRLLPAADGVLRALRNYCGSVAFDSSGRLLAVTSPRGGTVAVWDVATGRHVSSAAIRDVCGLAPAGPAGSFFASSGAGGGWLIDGAHGRRARLPAPFLDGIRWDNHIAPAVL